MSCCKFSSHTNQNTLAYCFLRFVDEDFAVLACAVEEGFCAVECVVELEREVRGEAVRELEREPVRDFDDAPDECAERREARDVGAMRMGAATFNVRPGVMRLELRWFHARSCSTVTQKRSATVTRVSLLCVV